MTTVPSPQSLQYLTGTSAAWKDLVGGWFKFQLWGRIGWLDIKRRYRRTVIGPFWSSMTLAFYTIAVGIVGAGLWHQNMHDYLPYLSSGMVVWTMISMIIMESCNLFILGHALLRNVSFEYSALAYALVWRNLIIFAHNLVIYVLIALLLKPQLLTPVALIALPGLALDLVNGVWIALLGGMLCLRFRDVQPLVQIAIQILMLVTPIFWTPVSLAGARRILFVDLNPIYCMIDVVRAPLLGDLPELSSYLFVIGLTVAGWGVAYGVFRKFHPRISYWS
jgi:ABC-type polysaccharide/polyol phosphate export permease